jgi:uncharacterized protein DUF5667
MVNIRKRADRAVLDEMLDGVVAGRPVDVPDRLSSLVETAELARAALAVSVDESTARRHQTLIQLFEPEDQPRTLRVTQRRRVRGLAIAMALFLVLGGGGAATAAASAGAVPGELLYPVKRAIEAIDLVVHPSASSRGRLHLSFADRRLREVQALVSSRGSHDPDLIEATVVSYQVEVTATGVSVGEAEQQGLPVRGLVERVRLRIAQHLVVLSDLATRVPPKAQDAIRRAMQRASNAQEKVQHGTTKPQGGSGPQGSSGPEKSTPPGRGHKSEAPTPRGQGQGGGH